jgi:hypothetical protein
MVKIMGPVNSTKTPTASMSCRIFPEQRLWVEEYRGVVGLDAVKALTRAVTSDPRWAADFNGLLDFSGASLDMSGDDVLRLALMWREDAYRSCGWLAFVVPSSAVFGVVRMLGYWSRTTERSRIFTRREEAEQWLREQGRRMMSGGTSAAIPA